MSKLRWLHLSDIHFNLKDEDCIDARNSLPNYMESIISKKSDKLDFIVISGDCTYQNKGYDGLETYLNNFRKLLKDECQNNFFIVPGNHDLERDMKLRTSLIDSFYSDDIENNVIDERLYSEGKRDIDTYNTLAKGLSKKFIKFYESITKNKYEIEKICSIQSLEEIPVNLIQINTCLFSYKKDNDDDKKGKLLLDTRGIKEELNKYENIGDNFNIAIGHHELQCFYKKDREKFEHLLSDYKIDLYLCGHTHDPENKSKKADHSDMSIICAGAMTADGSEIDVSLGEFSFEDGRGCIEHHKWTRKMGNWIINNEVSRELNNSAQWDFFVNKFIEHPVVLKEKNPLLNEIKRRYIGNNIYADNLTNFKVKLVDIHTSEIGINNCGLQHMNRCQESETIFSQLFRTTLCNGNQKDFFSKEDILIITILVYSYNIYKYYNKTNISPIKVELGKTINSYTKEPKLTDVCMEVLMACFNKDKFNKIQYESRPIENVVVHPKVLAVIIIFINKITCMKCLICSQVASDEFYRKNLNNYKVCFNDRNKCIEINFDIDEEKAFTEEIENRNIYRHIIDEIQNINDERMFFNSYCGQIYLIENLNVKINFINNTLRGYDSTIYSINDSISSINYNIFNIQNEDHHNIFIQTYPSFDEQNVINKLKEAKEER